MARWAHGRLAAAFAQWRGSAAEQQGLRRAAAFWMHGTLASAFAQASQQGGRIHHSWSARGHRKCRAETLTQHGCFPALPHMQWRAAAAHKAQQRGKVEACLRRLVHRQQALAWNQWRGWVQYR